jgi:hypothetical protein
MLYLQREKVCSCGLAEVLSPQITNRLGPQIANPQSVTLTKGLQNLTNYLSPQICRICDLRNFFGDCPPLSFSLGWSQHAPSCAVKTLKTVFAP